MMNKCTTLLYKKSKVGLKLQKVLARRREVEDDR